MKVVTTAEAASDLIEAITYVARDNPAAAQRLLNRYEQAVERLAAGFVEGSEVELRRRGKARYWSVRPYRIYYRREQIRSLSFGFTISPAAQSSAEGATKDPGYSLLKTRSS